ncbi:MAG: hypothetical protein HYS20_09855 [Rhodocyclales bacterium]|nr:hypothetical protein [Rhodocyclales bacterium]
MKSIYPLVAAIAISACTSANSSIRPSLDAGLLEKLLAYGVTTELNTLDPEIENSLFLRLHELPADNGECYIDTHGVCQYAYYLSVATFDEQPITSLYRLTEKGKLTNASWVKSNMTDYAIISVTIQNFTDEALKNNATLENREKTVLLTIDIGKNEFREY